MDKSPTFSPSKPVAAHDLARRMAPHPWNRLALDLDTSDDSTLGEWLLFNCVFAGSSRLRDDPIAIHLALREAKLASAQCMAVSEPNTLLALLDDVGCQKPEPIAALLLRVSRALVERHAGSVQALASDALDLESLGGALARLAPGFGRASVARFLRPLRDHFDVLDALPMEPAAIAAAAHLEYCGEDVEPEFAASLLRRRLVEDAAEAGAAEPPAFRDFESALEQLGRSACLRERTARCALGHDCPRREAAPLD
jgi:hypothetical protein